MPPKKGATGAPARKTTSTIAQAFRPASKKTGATAAAGKTAVLARSDSTQKLGKAVSAGASTSRSASPEKSKQDEHGLTKERLQEAQSLPELDVQDPQWDDIWATVRRDKLGKVGAIHAEDQNRVHHILRAFDLDPTFGPCLGMTRLERWKRANSLGEDPPKEVYDILLSQQGVLKGEYRESCLTTSGA